MDRRFLLRTSRLAAAVFTSCSCVTLTLLFHISFYCSISFLRFMRSCANYSFPINKFGLHFTHSPPSLHCKFARCEEPIFPPTSYDRLERVQQMVNKYLIYLPSWNLILSFVLEEEYTFHLWTVEEGKEREKKLHTHI